MTARDRDRQCAGIVASVDVTEKSAQSGGRSLSEFPNNPANRYLGVIPFAFTFVSEAQHKRWRRVPFPQRCMHPRSAFTSSRTKDEPAGNVPAAERNVPLIGHDIMQPGEPPRGSESSVPTPIVNCAEGYDESGRIGLAKCVRVLLIAAAIQGCASWISQRAPRPKILPPRE